MQYLYLVWDLSLMEALGKATVLCLNKLCDTQIHTLHILHLVEQDQPSMMYNVTHCLQIHLKSDLNRIAVNMKIDLKLIVWHLVDFFASSTLCAVPRPTSMFSCTPRRPRTDGPVTRCTHYNGSDQQFDTRVAAAQGLFFNTFLSSRIFCFGNLIITSVVRSSESATELLKKVCFFFSFSAARGITNV
ncbi:hypothetical protein AGLY_015509 [Aphis glycines]|uniref:Uncharacterized protein n=1 Tax=Aphis glycines TaxID=307491 RepID=A0A6G0T1R8_APHGL|nr:hypothetical protein AGLY_015509 [Aphis glycines]